MKSFIKNTADNLKFVKQKELDDLNSKLDEIESKIEKQKENNK